MQNYHVWVRRVLIMAILFTSYLLVMAWQKDQQHDNQQKETANAPKPAAAVGHSASANAAALPQASAAQGDLPATTATLLPETPAAASGTSTSQRIHVQTDMLDVWIDPVGGDVVQVALRKVMSHDNPTQPLLVLEQSDKRQFTARSGLIGGNGSDDDAQRPVYTTTAKTFTLADGATQLRVPLTFTDSTGVQITKTFEFTRGAYPIAMYVGVNNSTAQPWQAQLFTEFKRDNSNDPSKATQGFGGVATFLGGAWGAGEEPYNKIKLKKFGEAFKKSITGGYVALVQHYFVSAWVPEPTVNSEISTRQSSGQNIISLVQAPIVVAPQTQKTVKTMLYVGPKDQKTLGQLVAGLEQTVDYGFVWPIAKVLFWGLEKIHNGIQLVGMHVPGIGNWGWSIVLLTLIVKLILFPLSAKSAKSTAKMRKIAPKLQALKEKHGDDRAGFAQAMMQLYKDEKVSMLSGCMPLLLQMPIFLALYWVLMESVELRNAPWILWIKDLSSSDPYLILPIIMGASMYYLQRLSPEPTDPMQAKMMRIMPIVFSAFMLFFPVGLVLYTIVNNMVSIAQQAWVNHLVENDKL